jgi:proprotein convertase subtilisin/kexin type 5
LGVNGSCGVCVGCLGCVGVETNCTSCHSGKYLLGNACVASCGTYYFANAVVRLCQPCPTNCTACLDQLRCLSCANGSFLHSLNDTCLSVCTASFFGSSGKCLQCQLPCLSCLSQTLCLSCSGLFLYNSSCLGTCPAGSYASTASMACLSCNASTCLECQGGPDVCTVCSSGLILFGGGCFSVCPAGYYNSSTSGSCVSCP